MRKLIGAVGLTTLLMLGGQVYAANEQPAVSDYSSMTVETLVAMIVDENFKDENIDKIISEQKDTLTTILSIQKEINKLNGDRKKFISEKEFLNNYKKSYKSELLPSIKKLYTSIYTQQLTRNDLTYMISCRKSQDDVYIKTCKESQIASKYKTLAAEAEPEASKMVSEWLSKNIDRFMTPSQ